MGAVHKKILDIMKEIKFIKKDGKIAFGSTKYAFITDDDVTGAIREQMLKSGLIMYPIESESEIEDHSGKLLTKVTQTFRIQDVDDESFIDIMTCGQGMDSADKGSGKSNTNARKYALLQTFMLTGDDPDEVPSDSYVSTPVKAPYSKPTTPKPVVPEPKACPKPMQEGERHIVTFGTKHKGEFLEDVVLKDRSYVEWMANGSSALKEIAKQLLA